MDFFDVLINNLETNLLVLARVFGIFAFNPMFARKSIPTMVKVITSLLISIIAVMVINPAPVDVGDVTGVYLLILVKEMFVGVVMGFMINMFFGSIEVSGELMDMQSGLGMAKVFDPVSHTQNSLIGTIIMYSTYLYFFAINAHLSYIKLFVLSFNIIPIANWSINENLGWLIAEFFTVLLALVVKMALPLIISEIVVQFCVGILMKSVPQIQIMVINIQFKVILGLLLLFIIAAPLAEFIDSYIGTLYDTIEEFIPIIAG